MIFPPLKPDEHDEEPDADADGGLQGQGDGVEDLFADRDQCADQKYDALHEHRHHPELPRDPHAQHHREREERHDADARRQRERVFSEKPHQDRADERREGGRDDRAARRDPDLAHHARIDGEDVDHGEERSDSGDDFGLDGRAVFGEMEMKHFGPRVFPGERRVRPVAVHGIYISDNIQRNPFLSSGNCNAARFALFHPESRKITGSNRANLFF